MPDASTDVRPARTAPAAAGRLDEILTDAARRFGDRTAIRSESGETTFRSLEAAATRCAAALGKELGAAGEVVVLASPLDPAYVAAFYGIVRSGNVVAPINPFLRDGELEHLLDLTRAPVAIVTPELRQRLQDVRGGLPHLRHVLELGEDWPEAQVAPRPAAGDVACVQFTSGTTGAPKGAVLTHRNLLVNAAQVASAHGLNATSVVLNHLPKYHLMHMNSAILAGATQVLCTHPDVAESVMMANRHAATHYYSIPMRLMRLAADARLPDLRFSTVRLIASGGSALAAQAADALRGHFGVPVIQGYGLAETSPLTHSGRPDGFKPGSVGPPVDDTECRIVDPETREVLTGGRMGEVQIRGPQVMKGYLGQESPIDEEGWLSTGDVGHVDSDGHLFLVDRIKDVFKCDNHLVSPTAVERILGSHQDIAECVVVDYPDEFSGAVANAFVVLREHHGPLPEILSAVNSRLPHHEQIRHAEVVQEIPHAPTGKTSRRALRDELIRRRSAR